MARDLKEIQANLQKIAKTLSAETMKVADARLIYLWIDNDEGLYNEIRELARQASDVSDLARSIRDYFIENNPLAGQNGPWADLLSNALHEVDWPHVAEHYSEFMENEEEEEESEEPEEPFVDDELERGER